jgi:hypothetical protein
MRYQQPQSGAVFIAERWAGKVISAYLPSIGFITPGRPVDPKRGIVRAVEKYGETAWIDDSNAANEQRVSADIFADTTELSVLLIQRSVSGFYGCRANIGSSFFFTEGNDASLDFFRGSFRVAGNFSGIAASDRLIIWTNNGDLASASGTKLYIDNKPQSVGLVQSGSLTGAGPFKVGASVGDGWTGKNKFGLVVWFNKALTADEASSLSQNPWQLFRQSRTLLRAAAAGGSLSAQADGSDVAAGQAALSAQVALAAVGVSVASGTGNPGVAVPLSAAGLDVSGGSAGAKATVTLSATGLAQAAGAAGLSASVLLAGASAAQAAGNAQLSALLQAIAAGADQVGGSANLSSQSGGQLAAAGSDVAAGSAVLSVSVKLQATGGDTAGGSANGSASAPGALSATGADVASGSATWSALVTLTAAGFVQAMGSGSMAMTVPLAASGQSRASGSANATLAGLVRNFHLTASPATRLTRLAPSVSRLTNIQHQVGHV